VAGLRNLRRDQDEDPNHAGRNQERLPPNEPGRAAQVETSDRGHAVRTDEYQRDAAGSEYPIGERNQALGIGDDPRVAGAIRHHLPQRRNDDIAEKYDNTEQVNDLERLVGHLFDLFDRGKFDLGYDSRGRLVKIIEPNTTTNGQSWAYAWDDAGRLQELLADVRAGKITVVVVYKVDRLTRSLADFAKLVECQLRGDLQFRDFGSPLKWAKSSGGRGGDLTLLAMVRPWRHDWKIL
jgi:YD repeat-containing protein